MMKRTIVTPNGSIDIEMTLEEVRQRKIDEDQSKAEDVKNRIKNELSQLDLLLPRFAEDLINTLRIRNSIPEIMKQRLEKKEQLRTKLKGESK